MLKEYQETGAAVPADAGAMRTFARWISNHLNLTTLNKKTGRHVAKELEGATVARWLDGTHMPTQHLEALTAHYGDEAMSILFPDKVDSSLALIFNSLDALDASDAEQVFEKFPATADIFHDRAARTALVEKLTKLKAARTAACRSLLEKLWSNWQLANSVDLLAEHPAWIKAVFHCDASMAGWRPLPTWGSNSFVDDLDAEPRSVRDRADVPLRLAEFGCRVVAQGVEVPAELSLAFVAAVVAHAGLRLNGEGPSDLDFGITLDEKFVDLSLNTLFFDQRIDQYDIEGRLSRQFGGCEAHEWVERLAQFLLRTREHLEDELTISGLQHQHLLVLISKAVAAANVTSNAAASWPTLDEDQSEDLS